MKKLLAFLTVLLALAFAFPLTLTDDLGRTVTLKAPPKRIVTMLPSVTETVCALGACDRLVATDDYSDWPERVKALPKAGGLYNPNPELIVALKPDLVLVSKYGRLYETLERAGLTVYAVRTETYEDIFRTTRTLGKLLGLEGQAERLVAQIQREVYQEESRAAKATTRPRVYYEIDPTPYTVGPESFIVATYPGALETIRTRPGWSRVRAVQTGRICVFTGGQDSLLSRPGPRVAQGLRLLVDCFHGR